jgi:hypothetical protein
MEVYGSRGYAITVGPDRMRVRAEHDADEQVWTVKPLQGIESDSLTYLDAVISGFWTPNGDEETPGGVGSHVYGETKGELSSLDTNVVVMQILDAARESARTGKTIRLAKRAE